MPSLIDSFAAGAHSLNTYQQAMNTVANNTTNAATVGYADQSPVFVADSFTPSIGGGGISLGRTESSRDPYAEQSVRSSTSGSSYYSSLSGILSNVEGVFPLPSGTSSTSGGVAGMMNGFFTSFSSLSTNPNDTADRQAVINAAQNLSMAVNEAYTGLTRIQNNSVSQGRASIGQLNALVGQVQQINAAKQNNAASANDPGVDARLHETLESISKITSISTQTAADGTTSIIMGDRTPLLLGVQQYSLSSSMTSGKFTVLDSTGNDVSQFATGGQLGANVDTVDTAIPKYVSQLNNLAKTLADSVNSALTAGLDANNQSGSALFVYDPTSPAQTLSITNITTSEIAAASATNPGGNGNAIALSKMASAPQAAIGQFSLTGYYGNLVSVIGNDSANASNNATTTSQVLAQAKSLRDNVSAVSLDQEATRLTQYQQAFQATGKLISTINSMMQTLLDLIR